MHWIWQGWQGMEPLEISYIKWSKAQISVSAVKKPNSVSFFCLLSIESPYLQVKCLFSKC